jgi:hypothetical protein
MFVIIESYLNYNYAPIDYNDRYNIKEEYMKRYSDYCGIIRRQDVHKDYPFSLSHRHSFFLVLELVFLICILFSRVFRTKTGLYIQYLTFTMQVY